MLVKGHALCIDLLYFFFPEFLKQILNGHNFCLLVRSSIFAVGINPIKPNGPTLSLDYSSSGSWRICEYKLHFPYFDRISSIKNWGFKFKVKVKLPASACIWANYLISWNVHFLIYSTAKVINPSEDYHEKPIGWYMWYSRYLIF